MSILRGLLSGWLLICCFTVSALGQIKDGSTADPLPEGALLRMGSSRLFHATWLTSVGFSADDKLIGAADSDGLIRLCETATGKLVRELPKGTGRTIAFSPDGKTLAIGGFYNRQITLWDLEKNETILELPQNARALAFSKDGATLAGAGGDKIPRIWNVKTGKLIREFKGHTSSLDAVTFSPDEKLLASGGGDHGSSRMNEIRIWDVATGEEQFQLKDDNERYLQLPDAVYSLEFSPDGKTLGASGSYVVRLWDLERRKVVQRLEKCSYDIAFSPTSKTAVILGDFGIYDPETGKQQIKINGEVGVYGHVAYSHDGKSIVTGNHDGQVQLWNAETGKEIVRRTGHEGGIRSVAFSPDGTLAASVSRQDSTIRIWGTATGVQLGKIPVTWRGPDVWWSEEGSYVAFAPYGRELFTWTYDSTVRYWTPDNTTNRALQIGKTSATGMAFSPDGNLAAVVEYDGGSRMKISVHELDGGTVTGTLSPFESGSSSDAWVSALAFSPDGKQLAIGALGGSLRDSAAPSIQVWDIKKQTLIRKLRSAISPPGHLAFSPDGTLLASSPTRATPLQLWRLSDGVEVRNFKLEADAHGRDPAPVAFSPDGKQLAAADVNRDIYVWELTTGEKIRTFQGHLKAVTSLAFSPDGKTLLSGSEDRTMLLWNVAGTSRAAVQLTAQQVNGYWEALQDADANIAASAAKVLLNAPQQTLEIMNERLQPEELLEAKELPQLIAELTGDDAKASLQAERKLKSFGDKASAALFRALGDKSSPATRQRLEQVLQSIGEYPIAPESLQRSRAIQLLEQIGTKDAAALLTRLAESKQPTDSSRDAQAALQRLKQRSLAPKAIAPAP